MNIYPLETSNQNVPKNSFLIAQESTMSNEIITTYYADKNLNIWKVTDWTQDKAIPINLFHICRITGETEKMLEFRIKKYFHYE